jgi:hypothetical protein
VLRVEKRQPLARDGHTGETSEVPDARHDQHHSIIPRDADDRKICLLVDPASATLQMLGRQMERSPHVCYHERSDV